VFDINKAARVLGMTPEEIIAGMFELNELGLINMRPVGKDLVAIKVHPLEVLKDPRRDIKDVIRGYQLPRS
jgi:hypothetical protein